MALCWMMGMSVMAQTTVTINGLKYQLNGTEAYVSGYEGSPTDVVIPATIVSDGLTFKVTEISGRAFYGCTTLTSVRSVGDNLFNIGYQAFRGCTSLESISFPSVTSISSCAFDNCFSLYYVYLRDVSIVEGDGNWSGAFMAVHLYLI